MADRQDDSDHAYGETQLRLLQATLEIINEVGVEHATTRLIAERAGVNLQLIQYHFGGKDAMIRESQRYIVDRFFGEVGPEVASAGSLVDGIRRGIEATWELAQTQPEIVQPDLLLQTVRAGKDEPERHVERQSQIRIRDLLEDVSRRTGEQLRVPVEEFALLIVSSLGGLVLEYQVTGDAKRVEAAMSTLSELLVSLVDTSG